MRNLAANMLTVLIVAGVAIVVAIGIAKQQYAAPGPLAADTVVVIPRDSSATEISDILAEAGAIGNPMMFRLAARYSGQAPRLKFGEYNIPAGASVEQILALLATGSNIQHRVTVAEGLTSWEVVELLKTVDVLSGEIPDVPPEGALAPDTYFVSRGQSRAGLLNRMMEVQTERLAGAWADRAEGLPIQSPEEALVLASIIEKETGVGAERAQVSSVFINRLNQGMLLQTDPTIIYGITRGQGPLGRGITVSDRDGKTERRDHGDVVFNTYVVEGLPPTPIANPGLAALEAAVNPAETKYLYFVADGTGGHAFSTTLREHNRNVAKWRKIEKQRQAQ